MTYPKCVGYEFETSNSSNVGGGRKGSKLHKALYMVQECKRLSVRVSWECSAFLQVGRPACRLGTRLWGGDLPHPRQQVWFSNVFWNRWAEFIMMLVLILNNLPDGKWEATFTSCLLLRFFGHTAVTPPESSGSQLEVLKKNLSKPSHSTARKRNVEERPGFAALRSRQSAGRKCCFQSSQLHDYLWILLHRHPGINTVWNVGGKALEF